MFTSALENKCVVAYVLEVVLAPTFQVDRHCYGIIHDGPNQEFQMNDVQVKVLALHFVAFTRALQC